MSYKYQKGSTPDHVDSSLSDSSALKDHGLSDPGKKPKYSPSDSVEKYDRVARRAVDEGDVSKAAAAMKKYNKYDNEVTAKNIENDIKRAKANKDSADKYGPLEAAKKGKLSIGGGYYYGAEDLDSASVVNAAKRTAARDSKNRKGNP